MYPTNHIAYSINLGEISDIPKATIEALWNTFTDEQKAVAEDHHYTKINGDLELYAEDDHSFSELLDDAYFNRTGRRMHFRAGAGLGQYDMVFFVGDEFKNANDLVFDRLPALDPAEKQAFDTFFEEFFPGVHRGIRVFMTWC